MSQDVREDSARRGRGSGTGGRGLAAAALPAVVFGAVNGAAAGAALVFGFDSESTLAETLAGSWARLALRLATLSAALAAGAFVAAWVIQGSRRHGRAGRYAGLVAGSAVLMGLYGAAVGEAPTDLSAHAAPVADIANRFLAYFYLDVGDFGNAMVLLAAALGLQWGMTLRTAGAEAPVGRTGALILASGAEAAAFWRFCLDRTRSTNLAFRLGALPRLLFAGDGAKVRRLAGLAVLSLAGAVGGAALFAHMGTRAALPLAGAALLAALAEAVREALSASSRRHRDDADGAEDDDADGVADGATEAGDAEEPAEPRGYAVASAITASAPEPRQTPDEPDDPDAAYAGDEADPDGEARRRRGRRRRRSTTGSPTPRGPLGLLWSGLKNLLRPTPSFDWSEEKVNPYIKSKLDAERFRDALAAATGTLKPAPAPPLPAPDPTAPEAASTSAAPSAPPAEPPAAAPSAAVPSAATPRTPAELAEVEAKMKAMAATLEGHIAELNAKLAAFAVLSASDPSKAPKPPDRPKA
jgi:hypothetical protein